MSIDTHELFIPIYFWIAKTFLRQEMGLPQLELPVVAIPNLSHLNIPISYTPPTQQVYPFYLYTPPTQPQTSLITNESRKRMIKGMKHKNKKEKNQKIKHVHQRVKKASNRTIYIPNAKYSHRYAAKNRK